MGLVFVMKVDALLEAILLPRSVAVCKCPAHVNGPDRISAGNARADAAAKVAARSPVNYSLVSAVASHLRAMQTFSSPAEKRLWQRDGCGLGDGVWRAGDSRPCLPKHFSSHFARLTHGLDHASPGGPCCRPWLSTGSREGFPLVRRGSASPA